MKFVGAHSVRPPGFGLVFTGAHCAPLQIFCPPHAKVRFIGHLICYDTLTPTEKGAMNYGSKKTDDGKSRPGGG